MGTAIQSSFLMLLSTEAQVRRHFLGLNVQKASSDVPNRENVSEFNRFLFCCDLQTYVNNQEGRSYH